MTCEELRSLFGKFDDYRCVTVALFAAGLNHVLTCPDCASIVGEAELTPDGDRMAADMLRRIDEDPEALGVLGDRR